ncbi:MAG: NADH-quinone oxidoreductase subunit L [Actinobacteria bacterium]|nr:NADH-quinone oxidoreductase subunit L [Actinomycetota bacterium]
MSPAGLTPLIVGLPLLGAVVLLLIGRRIGRLSGTIASGTIALAFVAGLVAFFRLLGLGEEERSVSFHLFEFISVGNLSTGVDFLVDPLSTVMVLVVTGVGTLIHVYSLSYMEGDARYSRFFAYLNLFAASMLLLVLADNLLLLYVGWEGVGLCSYLLIGFWFERDAAANAAKKAFIVNRIGDFAFLIGIFVLFVTAGSLVVGDINEASGAMGAGIATTASLLLFAGATGKSAQIPLYVWLPDAMEGPTPVSALIHAATMVTAGVYMVARLSPVFEASGGAALTVVGYIGAATALWAALMACTEYDIKRVLAYSTVSQLGYMFLAHGVGAYSAGIFHLVTHAFFKALMFLGAGAVMHALGGATDMRKMGGLRKGMPIVAYTFLAGCLAISGIIPFSGFFSKDAILASAWIEGNYALWAVGTFTALLTAFYMFRLYLRVFEGPLETPGEAHIHDAPLPMTIALVPLAIGAVVGGVINLPGLVTLEHFLEPVVGESQVPEGTLAYILPGLALLVAAAGILLARSLYLAPNGARRRARLIRPISPLVNGARNKFYVDRIYGRLIVLPGKAFASFCATVLDGRVIDGIVNGSATMVGRTSRGLRHLQSGYVRNYALFFLLGVVVIFSFAVARVALT